MITDEVPCPLAMVPLFVAHVYIGKGETGVVLNCTGLFAHHVNGFELIVPGVFGLPEIRSDLAGPLPGEHEAVFATTVRFPLEKLFDN